MSTPRRRAWADVATRWRLFAAVAGLAIVLNLLDAGQTYVGALGRGRPISIGRALAVTLTLWVTLAALFYPALWLARRHRLDDQRRWRNLLIHAAAAAIFALAHLFGASLLRIAMGLIPPEEFIAHLSLLVTWLFAVDFLIYWAILGAYYAFHYYGLAQERALAAAQLRGSLTEARLQMLRAQLNPHFLFNALNAIAVLATRGEPKTVVNTVGHLGELLRVSLDDTLPQEVPLARELEILRGYLDIQRVRFLDRLVIEQEVGPEALDGLVPSLILQPLVENAIVHGITARSGPGTVTIRARRQRGLLELSVSDTGPGFTSGDTIRPRKGIGLASTEERLSRIYGDHHRLEFGAGEHGGAVVTIVIPFRRSEPARSTRAS